MLFTLNGLEIGSKIYSWLANVDKIILSTRHLHIERIHHFAREKQTKKETAN